MEFVLGLALGILVMIPNVQAWIREQLPWDVKVTPKTEEAE